ncbi:MAG: tRNA/rRNA methyltransferase [Bacteroidales bacterium]|nr:tRNA/rRNA methyltransferase [Bacteroidales bacterium]
MQLVFVLVEPAVPGNVGASARALKTMGFGELRLVNPCNYLDTEARMLAHGSHDILENAKVFKDLATAVNDCDLIIGTSAKHRRVRQDYYPIKQLKDIITAKGKTISRVAVVFGREESGLDNKELQQCHIITFVPMKTGYPSLNLSQAVMIYAYEMSALGLMENITGNKRDEQSFISMRKKAELYLQSIEIEQNQVLYNRILERLNILGEDDIHLLHSVFKYMKLQ